MKKVVLKLLVGLFICSPVYSMEKIGANNKKRKSTDSKRLSEKLPEKLAKLTTSDVSSSSDPKIEIKTSDGKSVLCSQKLCELSKTIKNMLKDCPGVSSIPLLNVSESAWKLIEPVLAAMSKNHFEGVRNILKEKSLQELKRIIEVSNYLDFRKKLPDVSEVELIDEIADVIAKSLLTKESLKEFLKSQKFLNSGLGKYFPHDLSNLIAQKIIELNAGCIQRLLQGCSIPKKTLRGHTFWVCSARFNNTGDRIVSASRDKTLRVWDVKTGECLKVLNGHTNMVRSTAFNNTGDRTVSVSRDKTIRVWDVKTGECLKVLKGHTYWVCSAAFNNTGDRVVSASSDKTVRIWDVATGECIKVLNGHTDNVWLAVFNNTGDRIVSASWDNTARIWDLAKFLDVEKCLKKLSLKQALLLVCWNDALKNGQNLDLENNAYLTDIFASIGNDEIKRIIDPELAKKLSEGV